MQMPYNASSTSLSEVFEEAAARGMWIAVNRPFAMGAIGVDKRDAFRFILERPFRGVILSGTTSREHLRENLEAFAEAAGLRLDAPR
jgi:hypothetical protein